MYNCKATEIVLGLVVLVFAFWQTTYSKWVIIIAAALLIIHGLMCQTMAGCEPKTKKPVAKKKAKKKKK